MRILLDTHIALWALADDRRLGVVARAHIGDPENEIFVSTASVWEIAIKRALGRSGIAISAHAAADYFRDAGYALLDIRPEHAAMVETLPKLHTDPFDRLLIAQAITEPLRLLTHDRVLVGYSETVILA